MANDANADIPHGEIGNGIVFFFIDKKKKKKIIK
jgi:hypothetical protein